MQSLKNYDPVLPVLFFGGIVAGILGRDGLAVFCAIIFVGCFIDEAIRERK